MSAQTPVARVVGVDPSLTASGLARIDGRGIALREVGSQGKQLDDLATRTTRLRGNVRRVLDFVLDGVDRQERGPLPVFAIEGPAFTTKGHAHDRSGQWWLLVHLLSKEGIVVEIPPSSLKLYATGRGSADKDAVLAAAIRAFPDVDVSTNNTADALWLAAMVRRQIGAPIEPSRSKVAVGALDRVRWPSAIAERN